MFYSPKITNPEEGLDAILMAAERFDTDRFLFALKYKNYDEAQLERMGAEIAVSREKLEKEFKRLQEFAEPFNKAFVTDNNKCYDVALRVLNKIKSGISETKRIYMKFCPRGRRDRILPVFGNMSVSAFQYSKLSCENVQLDLFGLEDFPPTIQGLYREMEKFFILLRKSIKLCKQVITDERTIRKDGRYCQHLYEQFKEKFLKKIANVIMMISRDSDCLSAKNNPVIAARQQYGAPEAFAQHAFHNYTVKDMEHYVLKETFDEEQYGDMSNMEKLLFKCDPELTRKVRLIIAHFDEFMPEEHTRKKLDAKRVLMLQQWSGIQQGSEEYFVQYFNEKYQQVKGHRYDTVTNAAVNSHKAWLLRNEEEYNKFAQKVQNFLNSHIALRKAVGYE